MQFNVDEQIFLKNDKTDKVYTLTFNCTKNPTAYAVTREWTVPNQNQLASKTDSFPFFKQAAEFIEHHYKERIKNGYFEVMRRPGVIKQGTKTEKHKGTETLSTYFVNENQTGIPAGQRIQENIQSRHRTGITDRLEFLKKLQK